MAKTVRQTSKDRSELPTLHSSPPRPDREPEHPISTSISIPNLIEYEMTERQEHLYGQLAMTKEEAEDKAKKEREQAIKDGLLRSYDVELEKGDTWICCLCKGDHINYRGTKGSFVKVACENCRHWICKTCWWDDNYLL